jgi:hypothetical protein
VDSPETLLAFRREKEGGRRKKADRDSGYKKYDVVGHDYFVEGEHECDETGASFDRRLLMQGRSIRNPVVPSSALYVQLYGLSDLFRQRQKSPLPR